MIAEFIKGKVDESLTKLVQPAGAVPAALFLLLNVAFILPALKAEEVGFATSLAGLDGTWQAVVFGAATLALGYVLLTSSATVLDFVSGEGWRDTRLYVWLQNRERAKLTSGAAWPTIPAGQVSLEDLNEAWSLRTRYPLRGWAGQKPSEEGVKDVGPTRLGNALRAGHRLLYERYGFDAVALWSEMEALVPTDSTTSKVLTDVRASLDTLVNLAFVLGLFALEGLVLQSARGDWAAALGSAAALPVAYLVYRSAVPKARAWGDAMAVACDLYREKLRDELELRDVTSPSDERKLWRKTSQVFLWGREAVPDADDIFEPVRAKAAEKAAVTPSRDLELGPHEEDTFAYPGEGHPAAAVAGSYVETRLLVSRKSSFASSAVVTVSDERLPRIPGDARVTVLPNDAATLHATVDGPQGAPDVLVLELADLAPERPFWLRVTLPVREFRVPDGLLLTAKAVADTNELGYDLTISSAAGQSPNSRWLEVFMAVTALEPRLLRYAGNEFTVDLPVTLPTGRFRFDLSDVAMPAQARLAFPESTEDE